MPVHCQGTEVVPKHNDFWCQDGRRDAMPILTFLGLSEGALSKIKC